MKAKRKILIHIGTGKTGSTAIQKGLTISLKKGDLHDIFYPLPLGGYHHQQIAALYYDNYEYLPRGFRCKYSYADFMVLRKQYKEDLFNQLKQHKNIVLCSEYLGDLNLDQVQSLRNDLDTLGSVNYKIVVYIREPGSYYLSSVQQQLKASSRFSPPSEFHYRFLKAITVWSEVFSSQSLDIRIFNPSKFPEGSVLLDFKNCVRDFFTRNINLSSITRSNESISAEGMVILQKYRQLIYPEEDNIFKIDSNFLLSLLQKSKAEVPQTKPQLSSTISSYVREQHQDDLQTLKNVYGLTLNHLDGGESKTIDTNFSQKPDLSVYKTENVEDILDEFNKDILVETLLWSMNHQLSKFIDQRQKLAAIQSLTKITKSHNQKMCS